MAYRWWAAGVTLLVGIVSLTGCGPARQGSPTAGEPLQIVVSIPPQAYFVDRIGGDRVTTEIMVPPGADPHTYEPRPEQLKALSQADAYMRIRVDFEDAWMDRFAAVNPKMQIVDTTAGIERLPPDVREIGEAGHASPDHGGDKVDPHIWLSPRRVKIQAEDIYRALVALDPARANEFKVNLEAFLRDIDTLDRQIRQALQGVKQRQFIVLHPAWGYFARDYDLQMLAVEVGGQEPSAAELADLVATARKDQIKVIFVEPQFSRRAAETLAQEIGGQVLTIDPLARDWLANLRQVADTFAQVLAQASPAWKASARGSLGASETGRLGAADTRQGLTSRAPTYPRPDAP
jgi:zinc transport system substrate-binding protein